MQLQAPRTTELKPRIVVFGVGGAGGNAVNNMIEAGLDGVEFVVANTDAQQLQFAKTPNRIQLGIEITKGLGGGAHPQVGMAAAEESHREIGAYLDGADMVFITAGMGGGTGTGAAPIIAKCARERDILTVGVVTKPFQFEGRLRLRMADDGICELQRYVDALIVIPNQNLFRIANEKTTFAEAFGIADQVLHSGVRSVTDLMLLPGLINLDFADVRTVMKGMGKAMMGTGEAAGEDRALMAAQNAIANPLLDEVSLSGAKAVLINVTGGLDMTLLEVDEAATAIRNEVDPDANIIFGAAYDLTLEGKIRVSVVATGMDGSAMSALEPRAQRPATVSGRRETPAPEPAPVVAEPEPIVARPPREPELFEPAVPRGERPRPDYGRADYPRAEASTRPGRVAPPAPPEDQLDLIGADPYAPKIEPLFPNIAQDDRRPQKSRWITLFGRSRTRYETPTVPQAREPASGRGQTGGPGRPPVQPAGLDDLSSDESPDLAIPTFLRRLAN
jgi:cell division protein FtsZ